MPLRKAPGRGWGGGAPFVHDLMKSDRVGNTQQVVITNWFGLLYNPHGFFFAWRSSSLQGGPMVSWLVHSSPNRVVPVRALAGDILLCSWARHLTLTVPLSTQVHKWVPANVMLGITLRWTSIPARGVEIFVVISLRRNPEITGLGMERLLFYLTFPNEPCFVLLYMLFYYLWCGK